MLDVMNAPKDTRMFSLLLNGYTECMEAGLPTDRYTDDTSHSVITDNMILFGVRVFRRPLRTWTPVRRSFRLTIHAAVVGMNFAKGTPALFLELSCGHERLQLACGSARSTIKQRSVW